MRLLIRRPLGPVRLLFTLLLLSAAAPGEAQLAGASGIAGVVRDSSGGVLPGVTVEASSPALIEKVRTGITDGQGRYSIPDLRTGTYVVTFTLPGFSTVRRENVVLAPNFTATINADLQVGALEETITVSSQSPVVDVLRVETRNVISVQALEQLPTNRSLSGFVALTPGLRAGATTQDVGGTRGEVFVAPAIHGGRAGESRTVLDGFETNSPDAGGSGRVFVPNPASAQAVSVELGNGPGEVATAGVLVNFVPRDGGNMTTGTVIGNFSHDRLQGTNLNSEIESRGLTAASIGGLEQMYDLGGGIGGPVRRDRLWFFTAHRTWASENRVAGQFYNATPESWFYTADRSRQAVDDFSNRHHNIRLTWQASQKNKLNLSYDWQYRCDCHRSVSGTLAPEASARREYRPNDIIAATWSFPATNRLLFEAGTAAVVLDWHPYPTDGATLDTISVFDQGLGLRYRAAAPGGTSTSAYGSKSSRAINVRTSATYVTGSHSFKTGMSLRNIDKRSTVEGAPLSYTFNRGVPTQISLFAYPLLFHERLNADLGVYAQDQWTLKRLTLNLAARLDYLNASVPAQSLAAGPYVPARSFDPVDCVPCWTTISPRLSAAYDLFGTGRTAIKVSVGRYSGADVLDLATAINPLAASNPTANRAWTDQDGDFVPDENELGPLSNRFFGTVRTTTRYDDALLTGSRPYNWKTSAALQHEVLSGVAVNLAYYHTTWKNFRATDNLALAPDDFSPFSIVAPIDARLPGGGGYAIPGLYNINPNRFGATDNLVTNASTFGEQTEIFDGVDLTVSGRFPRGTFVGGGLSTGRTRTSECFVIDSPEALRFCDVRPPFQPQIKLNGSVNLPWAVRASAVFQSLPGIPIGANYAAPNAIVQPSLGRPLAGGAPNVTVALIAPQSIFEQRLTQLDLRLGRTFTLGRTRIQGMLDIYNLLNGSAILAVNNTFGPAWLRPTAILDARLVKFGFQLDF
ncbi:MAG: carboxypeptidase regulatory-like domain-containing protein [Vicinamibacterales bacterium]